MSNLASMTEMTQILDQFSVPMFAVDRVGPERDFKFSGLNRSLAQSGALTTTQVLGKSLFDLAPEPAARIAAERYAACISARSVIRCRDGFATHRDDVVWDTTLQYVPLPDGGDRVVGTTIEVSKAETPGQYPAFDDIQYLSSVADLQLQNLITMFEAFQNIGLFTTENEQRVARLGGMCRTIQRAVGDIKRTVKTAQRNQWSRAGTMMDPTACNVHPVGSTGRDTLSALFESLRDDGATHQGH